MNIYGNPITQRKIFLENLNYVCTSTHHRIKFLNEIKPYATHNALLLALSESTNDSMKQLVDIANMHSSMKEVFEPTEVLGAKAITLEIFRKVLACPDDAEERDYDILMHMDITDCIEVQYFKALRDLAKSMDIQYMNMQYSYDTAKDNQRLFYDVRKEMLVQ